VQAYKIKEGTTLYLKSNYFNLKIGTKIDNKSSDIIWSWCFISSRGTRIARQLCSI